MPSLAYGLQFTSFIKKCQYNWLNGNWVFQPNCYTIYTTNIHPFSLPSDYFQVLVPSNQVPRCWNTTLCFRDSCRIEAPIVSAITLIVLIFLFLDCTFKDKIWITDLLSQWHPMYLEGVVLGLSSSSASSLVPLSTPRRSTSVRSNHMWWALSSLLLCLYSYFTTASLPYLRCWKLDQL